MSFALFDQIRSEFTLVQQGVDGDVLALNTDRVQQRDHRLDLIRAFDFVLFLPRYGQGANFFWVWQALGWGPTTLLPCVLPPSPSMGLQDGFSLDGPSFIPCPGAVLHSL